MKEALRKRWQLAIEALKPVAKVPASEFKVKALKKKISKVSDEDWNKRYS